MISKKFGCDRSHLSDAFQSFNNESDIGDGKSQVQAEKLENQGNVFNLQFMDQINKSGQDDGAINKFLTARSRGSPRINKSISYDGLLGKH